MSTCSHLLSLPLAEPPTGLELVCEDCVAIGGGWLHLRRCLTCQHVSCCDSSPNQHATAHALAAEHPVVTSAEPGETWRWCYVDGAAG